MRRFYLERASRQTAANSIAQLLIVGDCTFSELLDTLLAQAFRSERTMYDKRKQLSQPLMFVLQLMEVFALSGKRSSGQVKFYSRAQLVPG